MSLASLFCGGSFLRVSLGAGFLVAAAHPHRRLLPPPSPPRSGLEPLPTGLLRHCCCMRGAAEAWSPFPPDCSGTAAVCAELRTRLTKGVLGALSAHGFGFHRTLRLFTDPSSGLRRSLLAWRSEPLLRPERSVSCPGRPRSLPRQAATCCHTGCLTCGKRSDPTRRRGHRLTSSRCRKCSTPHTGRSSRVFLRL